MVVVVLVVVVVVVVVAVAVVVVVPTGLCRTRTGREASNRGSGKVFTAIVIAVLRLIVMLARRIRNQTTGICLLNLIFTARKSFSECPESYK